MCASRCPPRQHAAILSTAGAEIKRIGMRFNITHVQSGSLKVRVLVAISSTASAKHRFCKLSRPRTCCERPGQQQQGSVDLSIVARSEGCSPLILPDRCRRDRIGEPIRRRLGATSAACSSATLRALVGLFVCLSGFVGFGFVGWVVVWVE